MLNNVTLRSAEQTERPLRHYGIQRRTVTYNTYGQFALVGAAGRSNVEFHIRHDARSRGPELDVAEFTTAPLGKLDEPPFLLRLVGRVFEAVEAFSQKTP